MPLIIIKSHRTISSLKTARPLTFYAYSYVPSLILCVLIALFVFFGRQLQSYPAVFYGLFIALFGSNDALNYLQSSAHCGFLCFYQ